MKGESLNAEKAWRSVLPAIEKEGHEQRLYAAASTVNRLIGTDACNIYIAKKDSFALEIEAKSREEAGINGGLGADQTLFGEDRASEGIEGATHSGQITLDIDPESVSTGSVNKGNVWYLRIPLSENGSGTVGLCEVGPFDSERRANRSQKSASALALPLAVVLKTSKRQQQMEKRIAALDVQSEIGDRLVESYLHTGDAYGLLLQLAIAACHSDAGMIVRQVDDRMEPVVSQNLPETLQREIDLTPGAGVLDFIDPSGSSLIVTGAAVLAKHGINNLVAVPIGTDGLRGIVALLGMSDEARLVDRAGDVLEQFADQLLLIMENEELGEKFARQSWAALVGLAQTLDARFPHTKGHHELVTRLAAGIGEILVLDRAQMERVEKAAKVHDVGLSGLVEANSAFEADFQHPNTGAHLVELIAGDSGVGSIVRVHHEWYAGYGFPNGLKEDQIPIEGYVLATAEFMAELLAPGDETRKISRQDLISDVSGRIESQIQPDCGRATIRMIEKMEDERLID